MPSGNRLLSAVATNRQAKTSSSISLCKRLFHPW